MDLTEVAFGVALLISGFALARLWLPRERRNAAAPLRRPVSTAPSAQLPPGIEEALDRIVEGVILFDEDLRSDYVNAAARHLLGIEKTSSASRFPSQDIVSIAERARAMGDEVQDEIGLWFPLRSRVKIRAVPLEAGTGILVVLQDVTEEHLAQQIRREFVAHASHELKSPVASIQTLAEAVYHAVEEDPAAAVRFCEKLVNETSRLGRLVGDLLDLSRLEDSGRVPQDPADLSGLVLREADAVLPSARSKSQDLQVAIQPDVWVLGDESQLALMVRNLLENAVRYTPEGGTIRLDLRSEGSSAMIQVSDTGIGIPLEAQGRVFERFFRVDKARSRDRGGTGLGLAIVKHVAELHGGQVGVTSELGRGSTFTVWLPAPEASKPTSPRLAG